MPSISLSTIIAESTLTREIFGNIPPASKIIFYLLATVSLAIFAWGCYRRWRVWNLGQPSGSWRNYLTGSSGRFLQNILLQRRVLGRGFTGVAHVMLFSGFVVLLIGTTLIAIEHGLAGIVGRPATDPLFHKGIYYAIFELLTDTFGLAFMIGVVYFAKRRLHPPSSVSHNLLDWVVLGSLFLIGLTGYVVEGFRIIREDTYLPGLSPIGYLFAMASRQMGIDSASASQFHFALWWIHAILALVLIAAFPYTRLLHVIAGSLNLTLPAERLGTMRPVSLETVEETGVIGVGKVEDFSRRQLLMMDACVSCGRCEDACPAWESGKPLSPKQVVQDLRGHLNTTSIHANQQEESSDSNVPLLPDVISLETLWSCTTCSACVDVCPLGVSPLGMITDMRRNVVGEGQFRGSAATALQKTQRSGNPWGMSAGERMDWTDGLEVPTVESNPDFEILYWVGCAASYDRRLQKVARSVVQILQAAKVNFAVLGSKERCTGECARRMGDEFLFQELAQTNIATFEQHQVQKVITHCPHCFNSFQNDYPQFGGQLEVVHHSQFLNDLVSENKLPLKSDAIHQNEQLTFHDPCYLARANGVVEPPREVLRSVAKTSGLEIIEMPRHGTNTSCCGAGGGRMWFDDSPDERIGKERVQEALNTNCSNIAVGCPFCLTMLSDGVAAADSEASVRDISEVLVEMLAED